MLEVLAEANLVVKQAKVFAWSLSLTRFHAQATVNVPVCRCLGSETGANVWDLWPKFRGWADILITQTFITDYDVDFS